ncbi:MAG: EamA family transporter [Thermoleophilia bacterium]|nr:EamA family transporter [Thermoleophilia bacterium]
MCNKEVTESAVEPDHDPGLVGPASLKTRVLPLVALLLLALIWGYSWVVMKVALDYCPPFLFAALRTFLGAIALFVALILLRRPLRPRALGGTAVLGLLQTTGFVGFLTWALATGAAGRTSVLTYTMPFWLLLMASALLGERLSRAQWGAVLLAFVGLLLIVSPWNLHGGASPFLAVAGAVFWAASAVQAKLLRAKHQLDLLALTFWQMLAGAIPLALVAVLAEREWLVWSATFAVALAYVAILGNAVAWLLWMYILDSMPAGTAGLATLLTPVVGVLSSWFQLGERPGAVEGIGMIAIVGALLWTVLSELTRGRKRLSR